MLIGLDERGEFWLDGESENKLPGRLTIDEEHGATLAVDGTIRSSGFRILFGPARRGNDVHFEADYHIHGEIGGTPITLGWCELLSFRRSDPDRYKVGVVYWGGHFGDGMSTEFDAVSLRLRNTELWFASDGGGLPRGESFTASGRTLELLGGEGPRLKVRFAAPRPADAILETCRSLSFFVGMGLGMDAPLAGITLTNSSKGYDAASLYVPGMRADSRGDLDEMEHEEFFMHRDNMLFTYDDIGRLSCLSKWIAVSEQYRPVTALLSGSQQVAADTVEGRFIRNVIAIEAFARIQEGREIKLKPELDRLASDMHSDVAAQFGGSRSWSRAVVATRDKLIIHRGTAGSFDPVRLYWLAESLRVLLDLSLLKECDVPSSVITKVLEGGWFKWLAEGVRDSVESGIRE